MPLKAMRTEWSHIIIWLRSVRTATGNEKHTIWMLTKMLLVWLTSQTGGWWQKWRWRPQ